jgi:hypothetical protein
VFSFFNSLLHWRIIYFAIENRMDHIKFWNSKNCISTIVYILDVFLLFFSFV